MNPFLKCSYLNVCGKDLWSVPISQLQIACILRPILIPVPICKCLPRNLRVHKCDEATVDGTPKYCFYCFIWNEDEGVKPITHEKTPWLLNWEGVTLSLSIYSFIYLLWAKRENCARHCQCSQTHTSVFALRFALYTYLMDWAFTSAKLLFFLFGFLLFSGFLIWFSFVWGWASVLSVPTPFMPCAKRPGCTVRH